MRTVEIPLLKTVEWRVVEGAIDTAIEQLGLTVTLRGSLKKFPVCIHWHAKNGRQPGTLEITLWPEKRRAWFTIQDGRTAAWIDDMAQVLTTEIIDRLQKSTDG